MKVSCDQRKLVQCRLQVFDDLRRYHVWSGQVNQPHRRRFRWSHDRDAHDRLLLP
jgi:hypothetical protein